MGTRDLRSGFFAKACSLVRARRGLDGAAYALAISPLCARGAAPGAR